MTYLQRLTRQTAELLILTMTAELFLPLHSSAQDTPRAANVRFQASESKVIILYDLRGSRDEHYRVSVFLRKESDPSRSYKPKLVTGDVGENVLPGDGREIVWDLRKEIPAGLEGSDYYFVVSVEEQSSGFPWWTGAAVVGAGLISLLVLSSGSDKKLPQSSLPPPPGRP